MPWLTGRVRRLVTNLSIMVWGMRTIENTGGALGTKAAVTNAGREAGTGAAEKGAAEIEGAEIEGAGLTADPTKRPGAAVWLFCA